MFAELDRGKIPSIVKDYLTRCALKQRVPLGRKRLSMDNDYYETFNTADGVRAGSWAPPIYADVVVAASNVVIAGPSSKSVSLVATV